MMRTVTLFNDCTETRVSSSLATVTFPCNAISSINFRGLVAQVYRKLRFLAAFRVPALRFHWCTGPSRAIFRGNLNSDDAFVAFHHAYSNRSFVSERVAIEHWSCISDNEAIRHAAACVEAVALDRYQADSILLNTRSSGSTIKRFSETRVALLVQRPIVLQSFATCG
ncbi:hypothetical protein BD311DRAFT_498683 [Dichomitus squalens]|uniref:Uncharacterized protein n=1 Tax=Dichomitus squalens TaxID=114155 RepID=A0A4Q9MHN2_9APHY|nr:hypothetical protein BD311DRAFT_498683 [Dichomitus squalens]